MLTQAEKAERFAALHARPGLFLIPNPWDVGSARVLAGLGYEALATTSAGFANSIGTTDYHITRDAKLDHVRMLTDSVNLPVNADLENGFGDAPETCAQTIRLGAEAGLVGGSIEDSRRGAGEPVYGIEEAAERVRAAAEAAKALPFKFMLTGRCENYLVGRKDLPDTIKRLQAYQEAGADVLYAPFLPSLDAIKSVLASIDRPLNVLLGPTDGFLPVSALADIGVKRISVGSVFAQNAYTALVEAARELKEAGTFGFVSRRDGPRINDLIRAGTPKD